MVSSANPTKTVSHADQLRKIEVQKAGLEKTLRDSRRRAVSRETSSRPPERASSRAAERSSGRSRSQQAALAEVEALRQQLRHAQRLAVLGTHAATIAHEFNNILTPIINYAQLAAKNPQHAGKALAHAMGGGMRAKEICLRMLDITRPGGDKTDENMLALADDVLTLMARDPAKDGVVLSMDIPADLRLRTCRGELQQVLLNLLLNARHALMDHRGEKRICLAARREADVVTLSVSDSGPGVPEELRDRIFEPFFSTKSPDADDHGGHGLGLPICRDIITSLGGEITVQSAPGGGAMFFIRLFDC